MNLAKYFGFPERTDDPKDAASVGVTLGKITLPLDLAVELVFRQQMQLFSAISNIQTNINVNEEVQSQMGEHVAHLHNDIVEMQQHFEAATKHPVEKVDQQTEAKGRKDDKEKIH